MIDAFQDTLNTFKDEEVAISDIAIAWKYDGSRDDSQEQNEPVLESPDLTIPDILGWLTGRNHKPSLLFLTMIVLKEILGVFILSIDWGLWKNNYLASQSYARCGEV